MRQEFQSNFREMDRDRDGSVRLLERVSSRGEISGAFFRGPHVASGGGTAVFPAFQEFLGPNYCRFRPQSLPEGPAGPKWFRSHRFPALLLQTYLTSGCGL